MKTLSELRLTPELSIVETGEDGGCGYLRLAGGQVVRVIFSWGGGWDHVSVTFLDQRYLPTWNEMCEVRHVFFRPDECAVQYHPPESSYINTDPFVLHLWRPQNQEIPMPPKPPKWMV